MKNTKTSGAGINGSVNKSSVGWMTKEYVYWVPCWYIIIIIIIIIIRPSSLLVLLHASVWYDCCVFYYWHVRKVAKSGY